MPRRSLTQPTIFLTMLAAFFLACASSSPPGSSAAAVVPAVSADSSEPRVLIYRAGARGPRCSYERLERIEVDREVARGESEEAVLIDLAEQARRIGADAVIGVRVTTLVPFVTNRAQAERYTNISHQARGIAIRFTESGCGGV
ncbi:MAG TPA: hypothetical protein VMM18_17145 [Gemmatimonadaceae bacterium]|nr:hypothetical protein [Gemmatimonadaceae bacterium]